MATIGSGGGVPMKRTLLLIGILLAVLVIVGPVGAVYRLDVYPIEDGAIQNSTNIDFSLLFRPAQNSDLIDNTSATYYSRLLTYSVENQSDYLMRPIFVFDLAGVDANGTTNIVNASIFITTSPAPNNQDRLLQGGSRFGITNVSPADFRVIKTTDFGSFGTQPLSDYLYFYQIDSTLSGTWTLNQNGIDTINTSGYNAYSIRLIWDIEDSSPPWNASCLTQLRIRMSENAGTASDPKMTVFYDVLPVAAFSADDVTPDVGQSVQFTDASTNDPTSWLWDFGDGNSTNSTEQNPVHVYSSIGTYNVSLQATNAAGSDTETKTEYITVTEGEWLWRLWYYIRHIWVRLPGELIQYG